MSDFNMIIICLFGLLGGFGGYFIGLTSGMKDVEIEKLKTERDMYEKRLASWNENQKNI